MRLLLDTHVLLWWLLGDARIGPKARALIADPANDVAVSIASPWEIALKFRIGKIGESGSAIFSQLDRLGFDLIPLRVGHLAVLEGLPLHHRDPFDHMIIAQAKAEGMVIMTEDRIIPRYAVPCTGVS